MNLRKRIARIIASPANVRFGEMVGIVEAFGFRLLRVSGGHHIFGRTGIPDQINLQNVNGKAKPYQVRQFLKLIERYNLPVDD